MAPRVSAIVAMPEAAAADFYMFRSYEPGRSGFVTFLANYNQMQHPFGGPTFFPLRQNAFYDIHIDSTGDGTPDQAQLAITCTHGLVAATAGQIQQGATVICSFAGAASPILSACPLTAAQLLALQQQKLTVIVTSMAASISGPLLEPGQRSRHLGGPVLVHPSYGSPAMLAQELSKMAEARPRTNLDRRT